MGLNFIYVFLNDILSAKHVSGAYRGFYSHADSASSWWRVMALILLISSMGLVVGLVALGIMFTQQRYPLAEKESLSATLQQLAKKFCQELIKQSELKTKNTAEHKCSPCASRWRYHGDSCYGFFRHNRTWEESKQYCAEQNATLVKAASQGTVVVTAALVHTTGFRMEEAVTISFKSGKFGIADFLIQSLWKFKDGYWVGVYHDEPSRSWFWLDGSSPLSDLQEEGVTRVSASVMQRFKGCVCTIHSERIYFFTHSQVFPGATGWKYSLSGQSVNSCRIDRAIAVRQGVLLSTGCSSYGSSHNWTLSSFMR
ncbi:C-type lectin domain family 1 member b [Cricetulus griseus]